VAAAADTSQQQPQVAAGGEQTLEKTAPPRETGAVHALDQSDEMFVREKLRAKEVRDKERERARERKDRSDAVKVPAMTSPFVSLSPPPLSLPRMVKETRAHNESAGTFAGVRRVNACVLKRH